MDHPVPSRAALSRHHAAAMPAKQLRCQQVFLLRFRQSRSLPVLFHPHLHPLKQLMGNNGRDSIRKDNIPVSIFPDILAVAEQRMQAALTEGFVHAGQDMPFVEGIDDAAG